MSPFSRPQRKDDTSDDIDLYSKFLTALATGVDLRRLHIIPKFEDVSRGLLKQFHNPVGSSPCCLVSCSIFVACSFVTFRPFLYSSHSCRTSCDGNGGWTNSVPYALWAEVDESAGFEYLMDKCNSCSKNIRIEGGLIMG